MPPCHLNKEDPNIRRSAWTSANVVCGPTPVCGELPPNDRRRNANIAKHAIGPPSSANAHFVAFSCTAFFEAMPDAMWRVCVPELVDIDIQKLSPMPLRFGLLDHFSVRLLI